MLSSATPIDGALPFVIVLIALCFFVSTGDSRGRLSSIGWLAPILLLIAAIFISDERTRLFAYGIITAGAFALAVTYAEKTLRAYVPLTIAGVLLLRWIPLSDVLVWRELVVLVGTLAVLIAQTGVSVPHIYRPRTPLAIAVALAVAVVTPIFPARMLLFPFLVAAIVATRLPWLAIPFVIAAFFARYSIAVLCVVTAIALLAPWIARLRLQIPAYVTAIALLTLWPWSGLVARAFPHFLFAQPPFERRMPVWVALEPGQSVSIDVPEAYTTVLIASAANASRLRAGRVVGWVEAGGVRREIRIGDIADFGFMRREHFFASRNSPPRHPIDDIQGYGATAWLHTAGRISIVAPKRIDALRVVAAPDLPPETRLQIEAVEFE